VDYPTHVMLKRLQDDCLSVDFQWPEALIIHLQSWNVTPLKEPQSQPITGPLIFCSFKVGMKSKLILFSKCMLYRSYCELFHPYVSLFLTFKTKTMFNFWARNFFNQNIIIGYFGENGRLLSGTVCQTSPII